jgi:hypothetical protein
MAARRPKGGGFTPPPPDPEEEAALDRAASTVREFLPGYANPRGLATAIISTWIVERVRLSTHRMLCGEIVFNCGDAHLRGSLEAMLPDVGAALSHLPADRAFFDLSKDQVIDVLAIGFHAGRDAGALLNDEVPFG